MADSDSDQDDGRDAVSLQESLTEQPQQQQDEATENADAECSSQEAEQDVSLKKSVSWADEEALVEVHEIEGNPMWRPGSYAHMLARCCCCCRKKSNKQNY